MDAAQSERRPSTRLCLFGPPTLRRGGSVRAWSAERPAQLLVVLALRRGQWVPRGELAAMFWPDHPESQALRNLRQVVFKARALLDGEGPDADERSLRWQVASDLDAFEAALAAGRTEEALALRTGELLQGLERGAAAPFAQWVIAERQRIEALAHRAAVGCIADAAVPASRRRALAEDLLARDPVDEAAVAALIAIDLAEGAVAAARRRYRAFALRLAEQYGLEPSRRLRDLLHGAAMADAADAFVGRRGERRALAALLADPDCRAVAIVGPGGAGKSRLAREAIAEAATASLWLDLHDLDGPPALFARLAHALGTGSGRADDPLAPLVRALGGAPRLLALDNAESLPGLPDAAQALLARVPALKLIVTSRRRPGIPGERVLPLAGLEVPDADSRDADAAVAFDAVRLFDARARAARPGFVVEREIDAVVEIVERVGGLPLAIELAASWVRLLPTAAIAADLRAALDLLEREPGSPDAGGRDEHASMAAVLERSWAMLVPHERDALQRLAVFQGGFTLQAAREVAGAAPTLLSALVDKSMLQVDAAGRFAMHPLVAAQALARGDAAARRDACSRHAEHCARWLEPLAAPDADHRALADALRDEIANARAAWRHAVATGRGDLLARMIPAWRRHVVATGRFAEGTRLFETLLDAAAPPLPPAVLAQARAALAWFAKCSEDAERATAIARPLLVSPQARADARLRLDCLNTLGAAALLQGERGEARRRFAQSMALAARQGLRGELASALNNLALAQLGDGEFAACRPLFERAAALQRELGDQVSLTRTLHNLGAVHMGQGDWAAARRANDEALRHARAHQVDALVPVIEFMQGATLIELGESDAAARLLASAERRCAERGYEAYGFKAGYYRARIEARHDPGDGVPAALLDWTRRARAEGRAYDLLYLVAFVGEALAARGARDTGARLLGLAAQGPRADAYLRATVAAIAARSGLPLPGADPDAAAGPAFERVAAGLADGIAAAALLDPPDAGRPAAGA